MPDFTDFEGGDLIPEGTVAAVQFRIKYGDGTDGVLTRSQDGQSEMFKGEYTLLDGPFAKRKVSANLCGMRRSLVEDVAMGSLDSALCRV